MKNQNSKKLNEDRLTPSANAVLDQPEDVFELINKYGTYNIQPTAETENSFPKISQGLPKMKNRGKFSLAIFPQTFFALRERFWSVS